MSQYLSRRTLKGLMVFKVKRFIVKYKSDTKVKTDVSSVKFFLYVLIFFLSDMLSKISLVVLLLFVVSMMSAKPLSFEEQWTQFKVKDNTCLNADKFY